MCVMKQRTCTLIEREILERLDEETATCLGCDNRFDITALNPEGEDWICPGCLRNLLEDIDK